MNWTKSPSLTAVGRSALFLCALLFANVALAVPITINDMIDIETYLNDNDVLLIEEGTFILGSGGQSLFEIAGITIEENGELSLNPFTMVHVSSGRVDLKGILIVPSTLGTGIYNSDEPWDGVSMLVPDKPTVFYVNGGTVKIERGDDDTLFADTVHVVLSGNGTIDVESGVTFISGTVSGTGNLTKDGGGTWQVDTVSKTAGKFDVLDGTVDFLNGVTISGTLNVGALAKPEEIDEETEMVIFPGSPASAGTVHFLGNSSTTISIGTLNVDVGTVSFLGGTTVSIGTLNSQADTSVSGLHSDGTTKTNLTITGGGHIEGTLEDIGTLILTGGTLTLEGGVHTLEKLGIARNAILNIQAGTGIRLTSEDAANSYDDLVVEGTLKVSSAAVGIFKGDISDPENLQLEPTRITVGGSVSTYADLIAGNITGGTVAIYKSNPGGPAEFLGADTINTRITGVGKINVAEGVTFQSGTIGMQPNAAFAHVVVSGGGTYQAHNVNIGSGYFVVIEGTTMEFLEGIRAGTLHSGVGTRIVHSYSGAEGGYSTAVFDRIELAGNYDGGGNNLKITDGGWMTGHIANVNTFTLGGTLLMQINPALRSNPAADPMISTQAWTLLTPETNPLRVVGTAPGTYHNVVHVANNTNDTDWHALLGVLNDSTTALYKPTWTNHGSYLDLELDILSVNRYIRNEWGKSGENVDNIGTFIESISRRNTAYREYLEGVNDAQLQSTIRSALAGELAGNAMRIAMQLPAQSVFRHLDNASPLRSPFNRTIRGQTRTGVREGYNVWFDPFGQAERAKSDGTTFDGYNMSRYGFHLGGDIEIYNRAVAGVLFGYAQPSVKSDLGKISANDYTGGLYFRMPALWEAMLNMMVGFGSQDYHYKNAYSDSSFRGSSLFASVELSRPIPFSSCGLTPLVAMDFQTAAMKEFVVYDPVLGGILIEPGNLNSAVVRAGLLGKAWRIHTRLQYMRQVAGEDFVDSNTALTWDMSAATTVRGTQWGKDWLNVGIGGELLATRHWRVFADYNFDAGKRTTSHLGSLNTVLRW